MKKCKSEELLATRYKKSGTDYLGYPLRTPIPKGFKTNSILGQVAQSIQEDKQYYYFNRNYKRHPPEHQ